MAGLIVLSAQITATTADILQGTRLQTVPAGGQMTFQLIADVADATNNATVSIQMPSGGTPLNGVLIPASGTAGILDDRQMLSVALPVAQGGHAVFGITETGTVVVTYRVIYQPA